VTWRVVLAQRARSDLSRLNSSTASRIVTAIERFAETNQGDVKKLQGQSDRWRLRVGDWRVIFVFDRVQVLDPNGNFLSTFGSAGPGNGSFVTPMGIAADSAANLYVVSSQSHLVEKFTSTGAYEIQWKSYGIGTGVFWTPQFDAVDPQSIIWVTDKFNGWVLSYDVNGTYLNRIEGFSGPAGVAARSDGLIAVAETGNNRVDLMSPSGTVLGQIGTAGNGTGQFTQPIGVAFAPNGNLYVVDSGNNRVEEFALTVPLGPIQPYR
jgi:tripartite motif-containing protein 71